ncbi:hypothetical protein SAMN04488109_3177 [Chryseolinea serpens]|uniref:Uncharacterized protein n=1 Tax=Chryseolinea serpens TaxID=947013 RepID=A0A1M5R3H0_9BACT|nr:hypothetical protein [Chryseolinea serpens]SHH20975.1 hypothetical protein SAMN04488109_3177 [Chryseolinea serpens]
MASFDLFAILIGTLLKLLLGYILLGILVIALTQIATGLSQAKGRFLKSELNRIIQEPTIVKRLYEHPIIYPFGDSPAYLKYEYFVMAMLDILNLSNSLDADENMEALTLKYPGNVFIKGIASLLAESKEISHRTDRTVSGVFPKLVKKWFRDLMYHASGKYARKIQFVVFAFSMLVVAALNVDTIQLFKSFNDYKVVAAAVDAIDKKLTAEKTVALITEEAKCSTAIGWDCCQRKRFGIPTVLGWIISTVLTAFAALVTFDYANKYLNMRN